MEWLVCWDKFLPSSCSNRCGKVNIELHIDWTTTKTTATPTTVLPFHSREQKNSVSISSFNDMEFSIIFDSFFTTFPVIKFHNYSLVLL